VSAGVVPGVRQIGNVSTSANRRFAIFLDAESLTLLVSGLGCSVISVAPLSLPTHPRLVIAPAGGATIVIESPARLLQEIGSEFLSFIRSNNVHRRFDVELFWELVFPLYTVFGPIESVSPLSDDLNLFAVVFAYPLLDKVNGQFLTQVVKAVESASKSPTAIQIDFLLSTESGFDNIHVRFSLLR
jgi:hypothetical protein